MSKSIPYSTQFGCPSVTQNNSQNDCTIVLVYTEKMTERQNLLMKDSQDYLCQYLNILINQVHELATLPTDLKYFVIPSLKDELVRKIRTHFKKPLIFLPRAVIEARVYYRVQLPVRSLVVSLTMFQCKVFLVQSCNQQRIRDMINEMGGTIVSAFGNDDVNVVVTDTAENKYCARAFKRNIPVVPPAWVDENYNIALEEDNSFFKHNALTMIDEHRIKPFFGLKFKIDARVSAAKIKQLIIDNQGSIIYGKDRELTHIVTAPGQDRDPTRDGENGSKSTVKHVDVDFLQFCAKSGYYLSKREYRELTDSSEVVIEGGEEQAMEVVLDSLEENNTPPTTNGIASLKKTGTQKTVNCPANNMLPPPPPPQQQQHQQQQQQHSARPLRQQQQQPDNNMDDMILKAMSTLDSVQTQQASTQMRRLPDQELQIEQTIEPSQALWWSDRRN